MNYKRSNAGPRTELRQIAITSGGNGLESRVGLAVRAAVPLHDGGKIAGGRRRVPGVRLERTDLLSGQRDDIILTGQ